MRRISLTIALIVFSLLIWPMCSYSRGEDDSYYALPGVYNAPSDQDNFYSEREYQDQSSDYYPPQRTYRQSYRQASNSGSSNSGYYNNSSRSSRSSRFPQHITAPGERVIIVDPKVHGFAAYNADGTLVRSGMASAGSGWCSDLGHPCHTKVGSFRIFTLGNSECVSSKFPLGVGGAPMPYCMYFNGNQALHGSYEVANANISHGCVRLHVNDAEWLRFNFARIGTKVIVRPY